MRSYIMSRLNELSKETGRLFGRGKNKLESFKQDENNQEVIDKLRRVKQLAKTQSERVKVKASDLKSSFDEGQKEPYPTIDDISKHNKGVIELIDNSVHVLAQEHKAKTTLNDIDIQIFRNRMNDLIDQYKTQEFIEDELRGDDE